MSRSEGEIVIGHPVDVVSGYVPDQSNEPLHNLRMVRAEKSIAGSAGKGTQFRSAVAPMGRPAEMLIECTACDRPTLFASTTTMQPQATGMSATTLRTSRCPSRERSSRPTSPLRSRRRAFSRDGTRITQNLDFDVAGTTAA